MRRVLSFPLGILLILILSSVALFTQAQVWAESSPSNLPSHSSRTALVDEPVIRTEVQPDPEPAASLPLGVPEFASPEQSLGQVQRQAQKEQAEQNRKVMQIMQNHDLLLARASLDSAARLALNPQVFARQNPPGRLPSGLVQLPQETLEPALAGEGTLPLSDSPALEITLETVHRNDNFNIASTIVITSEAVVDIDVLLEFRWPNGELQTTYNLPLLSPGSSYYLDLQDTPGIGDHFVGSVTAVATDLISGAILTPDYGMISGQVFDTDGITLLSYPWLDLHIDYGNNYWEYRGGYSGRSDGHFYIGGLSDGMYILRVMKGYPYAVQFFSETVLPQEADRITITAGSDFLEANFIMQPGGRISGTVYAADGVTPLPNINVDLIQGWYGSCTDSNGVFTIDNIPYDSQYIQAGGDYNWCLDEQSIYIREYYDAALHLDQATPLEISAVQDAYMGIDFSLDLGGSISGTVRAQQGGQPLENVLVAASIYAQDEWYWGHAWTDAAGNYNIVGLVEGDYRVRIDDGDHIPLGYAAQYYDHTPDYSAATPVPVTLGSTVPEINFDLEPGGAIRGRLTDQVSGVPIPYMKVEIHNNPGYGGTCSDDQGYYELRGLVFGEYEVKAGGSDNWCQDQPSTYAQEYYQEAAIWFDRSLVSVSDITPVEGVDFTLSQGGFISGTVSDGGAPVPGLYMAAIVINPYDRDQWFWVEGADTDDQGNYTIGPLPPWDYKVYACADCNGQLLVSEYYQDVYDIHDAADVPVSSGETTSGINLELGQGLWITGHVSVPAGYSPEGIPIDAWLFDSNYGTSSRTDANGDYILPVPPIYDSMWGISARPYDTDLAFEWAHRVWLDQDTTWDFDLGPGGVIEGCITDGGVPVPYGWVGAEGSWMEYWVQIDSSGCYRITNLPPGDYQVRGDNWPDYYTSYYGAPNWDYAAPVHLETGETEPGIDFEMHRMGAISGWVRDYITHDPLEGIQVVAMSPQGYFQAWTQVDGSYNLDLPVGDYKIFYFQESWEQYFGTFYPYSMTYEGGETVTVLPHDPNGDTQVNIDFRQKAEVNGQVTDSVSGAPLGGVFVKLHTLSPSGSYEPSWTSSTCTDESGNFSLGAFWPGRTYRITAAGTCGAFQYEKAIKEIYVEPGGSYVENINMVAGPIPQAPFTIRTNGTDYLPDNNPLNPNLHLLFEPLAKLDDQGNWTSNLLQQVPTVENGGVQVVDSQMIVTYQLKPGLLWSDGVPLTSADIRYAWQRFNTPTLFWNVGGSLITRIERIETPDALTAAVYFYKDQISPNYLEAIPYAIPQHVLQDQFPFFWARFYLENPVGNGPYIVEEFLADSHVILRANPNYVLRSQGLPKIERIRQLSVGDPYGLVASGHAQVALDLADGNSISTEAGDFLNVQATTVPHVEFLWLNHERPAFQDINVRRALLMALDRARLADYNNTTGYPSFMLAENFYPPGYAMYSDIFDRYNYSLSEAANLLSTAGWSDHNGDGIRDKNGVEMVFTMAYPEPNDRRTRLATIFQEDLGKIGVRLTLLPQPDFWTMFDNGAHGMYDMLPVAWGFDRFINDPAIMFHSSQIPTAYNSYNLGNLSRWENSLNDSLLDAALGELSFSTLSGLYAEWTLNLMDQVPALPTIHSLKYDLAVPTLVNFKPGTSVAGNWNVAEWYQPDNPYDLGVRKTLAAESAAPQPGGTITYALTVDNSGYFGVTNAMLVDILPDSVSYLSAMPAPATISGSSLYWSLGDLAAGQRPPVIYLTVQVSNLLQHNDTITNQAQVYADQVDTRPSNNAVAYTLTVREDIDLWLEKHGIGQPAIGEKFIYYIEYGNLGGAPAANVVITDTLPTEVTFITSDPLPVSQVGSLLTWEIGELAGDQWGGQIKIIAEITDPGHVVNHARVEPVPGETSTTNNADDHVEDVSTILAPVILRPTQGTTDGEFPVKGLAPSNATVYIYDILEPATPVLLATTVATADGTFEVPLALAQGSHILAAKAEKALLTSAYSNVASIQVSHTLPLDPDDVTIKVDGVDFSAGVVRAEQYMLSHRLLEIDVVLPCATAPDARLLVNENGLFDYTVAPVALLDQGGGQWKASFRFWLAEPESNYDVKIEWDCNSSTFQELLVYILIDPDGFVYDQVQVDAGSIITASLVTDAEVIAYARVGEDWVVWPAHLYGQYNPQVTDGTTEDEVKTPGYYSFLTPPGQYRIEATAPGYQPYASEVLTVISDPIHLDIGLIPIKGGVSVVAAPANLGASHLDVDQSAATLGSMLIYDLYLVNQGDLGSGALSLEASIPAETTYILNSLSFDHGTASFNATAQVIEWSGELAAGQTVHISYQVEVSGGSSSSFMITSQAILDGSPEVLQTVGELSAHTLVNLRIAHIPLVIK